MLSSVEFDLPTIAVGNLSVGGSGKTPHVEYLIRLLKENYEVATLSRGYNRKTRGYLFAGPDTSALQIGDEPMQFHVKFPGIAVGVGEQRVLALPQLLMDAPDTQVVLLDDAFQHRSIKPGRNIMVTEYNNLFTRDHIIPFGRLRESRSCAIRADDIIVSKCPPEMSLQEKEKLTEEIRPLPHQQLYFTTFSYGDLYDFNHRAVARFPKDTTALVICGIAYPQPMTRYLTTRFDRVELMRFPDHYYFSGDDIRKIKDYFGTIPNPRKIIITTEKDAVRLQLLGEQIQDLALPLYVLPLEVRFLFNAADSFNSHIFEFVQQGLNQI